MTKPKPKKIRIVVEVAVPHNSPIQVGQVRHQVEMAMQAATSAHRMYIIPYGSLKREGVSAPWKVMAFGHVAKQAPADKPLTLFERLTLEALGQMLAYEAEKRL